MRIKISTFKSRLKHSPEFDRETERFLTGIEKELHCPLSYAEFDDYDCDLKLIFIQTGGSEGAFLDNFDKLKEPYYLLTNGGNNSLAASLEILTYLNGKGKKGEILHGTDAYIAQRIQCLAAVNGAKNKLANSRLGVIGKPSDWLIASVPDYETVKQKFGATLVDVPLSEGERSTKAFRLKTEQKSVYPQFDERELSKALDIYGALERIKENYRLDGLTIRCFDLLSSLRSTGCLALAELNKNGITSACEGDVAALLSMYIIKLLTGRSSFQANPSRIDVENNTVTFAHCTVPLDMVNGYKFDTHFESGIGVAVKGEMKRGKVTLLRLSAELDRYFVCEGTLIGNPNEKDLCRTQAVIKLNRPVTELLTQPCGNHHAIVYGEHEDVIRQLLDDLL